MLNERNAIDGALVADAASLGLHWMYDLEQLHTLESAGDVLFRHPEAAVYENRKAFFAHAARRSGQLSHYGESARIVAQLTCDGSYSAQAHQQAFMAAFGPCGSYVGYADRPTKALIARIIAESEDIPKASGMDDDQLPALCVLPGLVAGRASEAQMQEAIAVISTHDHVKSGAAAIMACIKALQDGQKIEDSLKAGAEAANDELGEKLSEALDWPSYDPLSVAQHFGLACKVYMGLPVAWHLLKHASDFESTIRDNVRCGGDNCGRAMVVGAIAGLLFGVPENLIQRLEGSRIPLN